MRDLFGIAPVQPKPRPLWWWKLVDGGYGPPGEGGHETDIVQIRCAECEWESDGWIAESNIPHHCPACSLGVAT